MAKFNIGDRVFPSKAEAKKHIQEILHAAPVGVPIGEHRAILADVLRLHPNAEDKFAGGLGHFYVTLDDWGKKCFVHRSVDYRHIVWSYLVCFQPGLASPESSVRQALRAQIDYQVAPLRRPGHEVDHVNPGGFADLARRFEEHYGGARNVLTESGEFGRFMSDDMQALLWREFHLRFAEYEVVTTEEHKARTAQRRREGSA